MIFQEQDSVSRLAIKVSPAEDEEHSLGSYLNEQMRPLLVFRALPMNRRYGFSFRGLVVPQVGVHCETPGCLSTGVPGSFFSNPAAPGS